MDSVFEDNLRLSQLEHFQQHIYLRSHPRCLGLVLGNACNIDCPHCYQAKNGDNLLKPAGIGRELRREFMGLYPYLATLRVQGGEAMAYAGFRELVEDVAATVSRPILSISTNGTLIDEEWAERMVRLPFCTVTVSIDGGTPETYARLRRGARLEEVLGNVRRIQRWKEKLASQLPVLDSFFVVMRSNFREIPRYMDLMHEHGFLDVALQTMDITGENASREPSLEQDEAIADPAEVRELYALMREVVPKGRARFRMIRTSGLTSLFESQGLDAAFLREQSEGLYPNGEDLVPREPAEASLCPNPWTTLFVAENGDVHLCFLSEPVGNLYETPLAEIWNSPRALAKRSRMIRGRYLESGCSALWCSWRQGRRAPAPDLASMREEMRQLAERAAGLQPLVQIGEGPSEVGAVRRMLSDRGRRIFELEALFAELCETNGELHRMGQEYIDSLQAEMETTQASKHSLAAALEEAQRLLARPAAARIGARVGRLLAKARLAVDRAAT